MNKHVATLALLVSAFSGLTHADDSAIQLSLKNWVYTRPRFSRLRCQASKPCSAKAASCM